MKNPQPLWAISNTVVCSHHNCASPDVPISTSEPIYVLGVVTATDPKREVVNVRYFHVECLEDYSMQMFGGRGYIRRGDTEPFLTKLKRGEADRQGKRHV